MARNEDSHPSPMAAPSGFVPPEVGRPRGSAWKALQQEGIEVESQVQIVGDENDLAARLILTGKRLVLVSGGQIVIEFPRTWLRPQAKLLAENGIRVFITPEGAEVEAGGDGAAAERITLRARDGRGAAASLVSIMTGKPVAPAVTQAPRPSLPPAASFAPSAATPTTTTARAPQRAGSALPLEIPTWRSSVASTNAQPIPAPPVPATPPTPGPEAAILSPDTGEAPLASRVTPNWATTSGQRGRSDRQPISTRTQAADGTSGSIAAWTAQNLDQKPARTYANPAPVPTPVPSSVSRAAQAQGTGSDGRTIRDDAIAPISSMQTKPGIGHRAAVWTLRAAVIVLFLGGATFLGRDYLRTQIERHDIPLPAGIETQLGIARHGEGDDPNGTDVGQFDAPETIAPTETVAAVIPTLTPTIGNGDNIKDDRGGTSGPIPTASVQAPFATEAPVTEEPAAPTEAPVTEEVVAPTVAVEIPTEEPTQEPTEATEPTQEPTEAVEPTQAVPETIAPTEEVTEPVIPTEAASPSPTATVEPTQTATPTMEPTVGPSPTPTLEPQPASVSPDSTPDQQVAADGFRFAVEGASYGESVPELPEINAATGYGNWLVLRLSAQNTSTQNQVFDMSQFRVYADGQELQLDEGNAWVNSLLGLTPAYGATDAILWAPGESHDVALTFLAPLNAQSLVLQIGDQTMDLSSSLQNPGSLFTQDSAESAVPDYIEAKVVEVVNGETIVVDVDGVRQPVRYLGIQAPTDPDCFASEATAANAALVDGQTVRIERQSTNVDPRGNWVRDVWAPTQDGRYQLVSALLVSEGAAAANISEPNTRFSGWLMGGEAAAKAQGLGLWASCGSAATTTTSPEAAGTTNIPTTDEVPQPTIAPVGALVPTTRETV
ncbi:MAG: thermonuclease family protein [Thermomicrobiales bacterium]